MCHLFHLCLLYYIYTKFKSIDIYFIYRNNVKHYLYCILLNLNVLLGTKNYKLIINYLYYIFELNINIYLLYICIYNRMSICHIFKINYIGTLKLNF